MGKLMKNQTEITCSAKPCLSDLEKKWKNSVKPLPREGSVQNSLIYQTWLFISKQYPVIILQQMGRSISMLLTIARLVVPGNSPSQFNNCKVTQQNPGY